MGPTAPITIHRTATHSLIGGLPLALGVAAAIYFTGPRTPSWTLPAFAYLGVLSHIALDLTTGFGTAVFWPLDTRRFALGWLYVIDPVVTGIVLAGLFVAARFADLRRQAACLAIAAGTLYVITSAFASQGARRQFTGLLLDRGITPDRVVLVPVFPGPFRWLGVAETGPAAFRARFWLGREPTDPLAVFPKANDESALDALPEIQAFRVFAGVGWYTASVDGDTRIIEYHDLAFEDHPWGGPMSLRVTVDMTGSRPLFELGHKF